MSYHKWSKNIMRESRVNFVLMWIILFVIVILFTSCNNSSDDLNKTVVSDYNNVTDDSYDSDILESKTETDDSDIDSEVQEKSYIFNKEQILPKSIEIVESPVDFNDSSGSWIISDEETIALLMSKIEYLLEIKEGYINDGSYEKGASVPGYIIKTNDNVYEDMYFLTRFDGFPDSVPDGIPNFTNNFIDYNIPQELIDEIFDIVDESKNIQ